MLWQRSVALPQGYHAREPVMQKPRAHSVESTETFQELATVINVYKLARYNWEAVEFDERVIWEERMDRWNDLEESYAELLWFIERMDTLPPSSRQQLSILFYETHSQEVRKLLQPRHNLLEKRRKFDNDSDTDSDSDSRPFAFHDDPFSSGSDQEPDSP